VVIFGTLQQVLTQMQVQPEVQNIIIGGLLLVSVVLPGGGEAVGRLRARLRTGPHLARAPATQPAPPSSSDSSMQSEEKK
jgi:hypothetical protein